ncbi:hypothetical protein [Edaphobacter aggregans]|uniref:hypothetical protein n=1 Tax=Edaphobacter aggregans TaxID=570835 RepID=UPI000556FE97|nr:hypothetical protein [Edaphobacter aggregans]
MRKTLVGLTLLAAASLPAQTISPSTLPRLGTVSPRFQSFNIQMVEVTGGCFWAPYKTETGPASACQPDSSASIPAGMDPSLYRYRPPIDLSNPKLRKLAAALGPSYVRVSGTWANSTYFHDSDAPAPPKPPGGFGGILTRKQWKGVINFSKAVDAQIVTSFAVSAGVRDSSSFWTPAEAKKFLDYTKAAGGSIAAAEMFNEPSFASIGGAPKDYDAAAYGRDFNVFHAFISKAAPKMTVLGPGSIGEPGFVTLLLTLKTPDMLAASGPGLDAFSYHFYPGVSQRCQRTGAGSGLAKNTPEAALTDAWLSLTNRDEAFYATLRDKYLPGKPLWLTETGQAACGGDPWAITFIDTFRYLNQLGTLAKHNVQVVIHNTLAASDYALLDEETFTPHPNYWAALVWRRLMGTTVLDADPAAAPSGTPSTPGLYLYAHCLRAQPGVPANSGAVVILAINADRNAPREITLPEASLRYTLASDNLTSTQVALNGVDLRLDNKGNLPTLIGTPTPAGKITLAPTTITFLAVAKANNPACR